MYIPKHDGGILILKKNYFNINLQVYSHLTRSFFNFTVKSLIQISGPINFTGIKRTTTGPVHTFEMVSWKKLALSISTLQSKYFTNLYQIKFQPTFNTVLKLISLLISPSYISVLWFSPFLCTYIYVCVSFFCI